MNLAFKLSEGEQHIQSQTPHAGGGIELLRYRYERDAAARRLVVNDTEARTVGDIYRRYLALKSVRALADELAAAGIRSKRRVRPDGTEYGGHRLRPLFARGKSSSSRN